MKQLYSLISGITLIAFVLNPIGGIAYGADTPTSGVPVNPNGYQTQAAAGTNGTLQYTPANFDVATATSGISGGMAACQAPSALGALASLKKGSSAAGGNCYTDSAFSCASSCYPPSSVSLTCDDAFTTVRGTGTNKQTGLPQTFVYRDFGAPTDAMKDAQKQIDTYIKWKSDYVAKCINSDKAAIDAQVTAFRCMEDVMSQATARAAAQLQMALQQNQAAYAKQVQYQTEVEEQLDQIDKILGPEDKNLAAAGGAQFGGLLGIQKDINSKLDKMTSDEQQFKTDVSNLKQDMDANIQTLESERMGVMTNCMKGERNLNSPGAYSRMCFKPVAPALPAGTNGPAPAAPSGPQTYTKQACGAVDYVKSLITSKGLVTSNGAVMKSQSRYEKVNQDNNAFDAVMQSILREMGDYDQSTPDGRLVTREVNFDKVMANNSAAISSLSRSSGVDIAKELSTIGQHCTVESSNWKKQQVNSAASKFNKRNKELKAVNNQLVGKLQNGLKDLNSSYGEVMSVLSSGNISVSLNRVSCTATDPSKMGDCYTQMKAGLQDLLEGNTNLSATAFKINGGTMTPTFAIPCKGINGCVTAFKGQRTKSLAIASQAKKLKTKFVTDGNAQVQSQLGMLAKTMSGYQSQMKAQYDAIKTAMLPLGAQIAENPAYMRGEPLQQSEGADKSPGPFKNPSNMAAALSSMMQPPMFDPQNSSLQSALTSVKSALDTKKSDATAAIAKVQDVAAKLNTLAGSCKSDTLPTKEDFDAAVNGTGTTTAGVNNVGNSASDCVNGPAYVSVACNGVAGFTDLSQNVNMTNSYYNTAGISDIKSNSYNAFYSSALQTLDGINASDSSACDKARDSLKSCIASKQAKYQDSVNSLINSGKAQ